MNTIHSCSEGHFNETACTTGNVIERDSGANSSGVKIVANIVDFVTSGVSKTGYTLLDCIHGWHLFNQID